MTFKIALLGVALETFFLIATTLSGAFTLIGLIHTPIKLLVSTSRLFLNQSHVCKGKSVSCGAIVLYCLNLPPEVRYLLKNVFIVGMIPAPNSPNVWTIAHILATFCETFNQFSEPGLQIPTFRQEAGALVACHLLILIADLQAIRKVAGYLSHSANCFCSFCTLPLDKI